MFIDINKMVTCITRIGWEGKRRDYAGEGDEDKEGSRRRRRGSRFAIESKVFERKTPNIYKVKQRGSLVLGQNGSGEFRVFNGGPKPLYKGREGRQMGEGLEGTGEILLSAAKCK